ALHPTTPRAWLADAASVAPAPSDNTSCRAKAGVMGNASGAIGCLGVIRVLVAGLVMPLVLGMGGALSGQLGDHAVEPATTADATCTTSSDTGGIPAQYQNAVEDAAEEAGLPVSILDALFTQESGYDEDAVSHAGAGGVGQFMPATW